MNIKGTIKGASIGTGVGAVMGTVMIPFYVAMDLTAPISYPLFGVVAGLNAGTNMLKHLSPLQIAGCGIAGGAVGTIGILKMPLNLVTRPLVPVGTAIMGGVIGGVVGNKRL